ncbi:MAG: MBL fold metallo-hydrolase [Parvularcula sp.]|nr:MBL fold metallo-hydrolase [Parvularcula sp.]
MSKPFASSADTERKRETFEILAEGVYALTAEGDPNVGAVESEDGLICIEARATPVAATRWLDQLQKKSGKKPAALVLTHYHAVRTLGAAAFNVGTIIAHENTKRLIDERGKEDWKSEYGRMPRLFEDPDSIPGLTHPTETFDDVRVLELGGGRTLELHYCGRGHTAGDIIAWLPEEKILFAGDLVEAEAALYTGDAFHTDWSTDTLNKVKSFGAEQLIGGRGAVAQGREAVAAAIEQTRSFLIGMREEVGAVHERKGTLKEAFERTHARLAPRYGAWPIFEHCLPFNVQRLWDEFDGIDWPRIWTAERDREVWAQLQG